MLTEAYLKPSRTSTMELFSLWLSQILKTYLIRSNCFFRFHFLHSSPFREKTYNLENFEITQWNGVINKAALSWKFGHCCFLRDFFDARCSNYELFWKKIFQWRENGINNCFKPLISSVFATVASRWKSEQKETEK